MTSPQCTVAVKTADITLMGKLLKLPESIHKAGRRGIACAHHAAPLARERVRTGFSDPTIGPLS
ncbi:hypothetical protein ONE62_39615 (plasmid) [Rhodococcus opacus]|nr:hypothetical protein ONE62_39615 [Rhodococcus opacus]